MIYKKGLNEILYEGDYKEHHFIIRNMGMHPCAYIENKLKDSDKYTNSEYGFECPLDDIVRVHGLVSFTGKYLWNKDDNRNYIGWDYGHCCDWCGLWSDEENIEYDSKKWTTEEIYEEIKTAIDQLIEAEEKEE